MAQVGHRRSESWQGPNEGQPKIFRDLLGLTVFRAGRLHLSSPTERRCSRESSRTVEDISSAVLTFGYVFSHTFAMQQQLSDEIGRSLARYTILTDLWTSTHIM